MSRFSFIVAFMLVAGMNAVTRSQVPPDPGEGPGLQEIDKAMTNAEQHLTIEALDKAIRQADVDTGLLNDVRSATKALSDRVMSLRTSDDGKRLAAALDELSAEQVGRLIDEPPVRPEEIVTKEKEIDSLSTDLKKLRADLPAGYVPPDQQQDELAQLSVMLRQMLAHTRERDGWLTSLMSAAPKNLDLAKAPTLDAALADFRSRQQQAWNAAQRRGIDEARPEVLKQITESARIAALEHSLQQSDLMLKEMRQANELSRLDSEMQLRLVREQKDRELVALNKKLAESEAHRAVVNAQTDAAVQNGKAEADKVRLRQKCSDPEVKRLLTPFTAKGVWQPGDRAGQPWIRDRAPVSLSALKTFGALDPTERGLRALWIAGNVRNDAWANHKHPDTERPKWGFTGGQRLLSQDDWQQLRHIQDMLNELGDTMVELGMLSP